MNHSFQCQCGSLRGLLDHTDRALRGVCYCKDCQAYSHHIGSASLTHDALGGAVFVATLARHVTFTEGAKHLACLSLTGNGLLRWYARCCRTPMANTVRNWKVPYVGLIGACLKADPAAYERSFPRLQMRVNTGGAKQAPPSLRFGTLAALMGFMPRVMWSGVDGTYKQTPFFIAPAGVPRVPVSVLSDADRTRAYRAAA